MHFEGAEMNRLLKAAVMTFVLTIALGAFASEGIAKVTLFSPVQVNGKQLLAGDYKVSWTGNDNNVQVTFKHGKSDVVTAAAKVVERSATPTRTAVVNDNGSLKELQFQGKKAILVFNE
jgi:hypothetical protein